MYDIRYNGSLGRNHGAYVKERPGIGFANKKYTEYAINGADGTCYEDTGAVEDLEIPIVLSFHGDPDEWHRNLREIKKWLRSEGTGELSFSDDTEVFYKVKKIQIEGTERTARRIGELNAVFICEGHQYMQEGKYPMEPEKAAENPGEGCKPIYIVEGEGLITICVNDGAEFILNASGKTYINTELMMVYTEDMMQRNRTAAGDFDDLWLRPGKNTIQITGSVKSEVIPNWRY